MVGTLPLCPPYKTAMTSRVAGPPVSVGATLPAAAIFESLFRVFRSATTLGTTCGAGPIERHLPHFREVIFREGIMPDILEAVLWCAALATWLMLLSAFLGNALKPLLKNIRRALEDAFKLKLKR
jgi:hypothetical protein